MGLVDESNQILSKLEPLVNTLKNVPNASMLYLSDHGESLGEKGLYLHGFPYQIAPQEQTHIPMLFWASKFEDSGYRNCIKNLANHPYSQDNLFDTLLGLSSVKSITYQPTMDIFKQCEA